MAKRSRKAKKTQTTLQEFVIVTFAKDMEEARDYETILKNNEIPAMVKEQDEPRQTGAKGIAVMVPEDFLDEAHVVIESQDAYDDFYDFVSEEDDSGLDDGTFDDDF